MLSDKEWPHFMPWQEKDSRKDINLTSFSVYVKSYLSEEQMAQLKSNCSWQSDPLSGAFSFCMHPFSYYYSKKTVYSKSFQVLFTMLKFLSFSNFLLPLMCSNVSVFKYLKWTLEGTCEILVHHLLFRDDNPEISGSQVMTCQILKEKPCLRFFNLALLCQYIVH